MQLSEVPELWRDAGTDHGQGGRVMDELILIAGHGAGGYQVADQEAALVELAQMIGGNDG